ncbi:MAG: hypothetical protein ACI85K_001512 [Hyphomicrobiaceae bacterium]|jgi:hypothetical protein
MRSMMQRVPLLAGLSLLLAGCGNELQNQGPTLLVTPAKLGGPHEGLFQSVMGSMQGYEVRIAGDVSGFQMAAEVYTEGKLTKKYGLGGATVPSEMFTVGLVTLDPRRKGAATELTFVLSSGGLIYHNDAVLAEWDAAKQEMEATSNVSYLKTTAIEIVPGEPIVLWRWNRGREVLLQESLSDSVPTEAGTHSTMQATITFVK